MLELIRLLKIWNRHHRVGTKKPVKSYHLEIMLYQLPVAQPGTALGDRLRQAFVFISQRIMQAAVSPGTGTRVDDYDNVRKTSAQRKLQEACQAIDAYQIARNPRHLLHHVLGSDWQKYVKNLPQ